VEPGRSSEDGNIARSPAAVGNEQRVSGSGCVVRKSRTITRPVELGNALEVGFWLSAQRGHRPNVDVATLRAVLLANPKRDESAIGREPQRANCWIDDFVRAPRRHVLVFA